MTNVFFVSGGFRLIIEHVAKCSNAPISHTHADTALFKDDDDVDGACAGFDQNDPSFADHGL